MSSSSDGDVNQLSSFSFVVSMEAQRRDVKSVDSNVHHDDEWVSLETIKKQVAAHGGAITTRITPKVSLQKKQTYFNSLICPIFW